MEPGDHIQWSITSRCSLDCSYCFRSLEEGDESVETLTGLARILAENNVKHVTIGGGEPTLVKGLDSALRILKDTGVYTSLHTNGLLLNNTRLDQLVGLVDKIALPLDSLNADTQERLRGKAFMPAYERFPELAKAIRDREITLGYHTVFTDLNSHEMPAIYKRLKTEGFDDWRIYEYNEDLARRRFIRNNKEKPMREDELMWTFTEIQVLGGGGTPEEGYSDCLRAEFLLSWEELGKQDDERVKYVHRRDRDKDAYAFLKNSGEVSFYHWFSVNSRRVLGNVFKDGYAHVREKLRALEETDWEFDAEAHDEFVEAMFGDAPFWTLLWEGMDTPEDIEMVEEEYWPKILHVAELHYMMQGEDEGAKYMRELAGLE